MLKLEVRPLAEAEHSKTEELVQSWRNAACELFKLQNISSTMRG